GYPSASRYADDLSTQIAPDPDATGTSSRLADVPTEKRKRSMSPAASGAGVGARGRVGLEGELPIAVRQPRAGRTRGRERADVLVAALGEEPERHRPDGARRARDPAPWVRV